jgi:ribonuclease VapC
VIFGGGSVFVPFITLMEVEYKLIRERVEDIDKHMATFLTWPVNVIESDEHWRRAAARIKARGKISLADSWVASLALINDAELVHKDPEFDAIPELRALRLPYRRRGGA